MSTEPARPLAGPSPEQAKGVPAAPGGYVDVPPDVAHLVIKDDEPVDSPRTEKQQRLLTVTLYVSWAGPPDGRPFTVLSNVGLFDKKHPYGVAPDVMLSLGVSWEGRDPARKEHQSYFIWREGKPPDVIIEIVSNRTGGEQSYKRSRYAGQGVPYYVIFDPYEYLRRGVLRFFHLQGGEYHPMEEGWFEEVGLGLTLWTGRYEDYTATWLRWCDRAGQPLPAASERVQMADERAERAEEQARQERLRAERLAARLRELGLDPEG